MSRLIAIDPGTTESGVCCFEDGELADAYVATNNDLRLYLSRDIRTPQTAEVVIEMIASYGMAVGKETFETCVWIGRFSEASGGAHRLFRREVKMHFCQSARAKDANIWQAILDRYGGKDLAVGKKANPGPLYSVKSHARAALALGLCWIDGIRSEGL